ncbi:MAG: helix-turn-helix domain-containing protein, partial [Lachnospiraceae bacterium]|nr:helix-turn-helix domain-containing protein [Lachnospiraceae bacterium]
MNERLKAARKYLRLSQEFVARQMNLSRPTISAIESGQRKVSAEELARFAELYGVSVEELMYGR